MAYRKSKKTRSLRGSRTHGWGAGKKHRGKGHRGGVGRSGSGKRGQHKKLTYYDEPAHEKGGYKYPIPKIYAINLDEILKFEKGGVVDLTAAGFHKLLGAGRIAKKIIVKVEMASKKAVEKVEKAGGKVEGLIIKEIKVPKEQKIEIKPEKQVEIKPEKVKEEKKPGKIKQEKAPEEVKQKTKKAPKA